MHVAAKSSLLLGGVGVSGAGAWGGYRWINSNQKTIHSLVTKDGDYYLLSTNSNRDDNIWDAIIGDGNSISKIQKITNLKDIKKEDLKEWCSKEKNLIPKQESSLQDYKDLCTKLSTKGKVKLDKLQVIDKNDKVGWQKKQDLYTTNTSSTQGRLTLKIGSGEGTDRVFENFEAVKSWCDEEKGKMFVEANSKTYDGFKAWCTK